MKMKIIIALSFLYGISINSSIADVTKTNQNKVIGDVSVYLGVLPAEIIEGPIATKMHGGLPVGQFRYHVTIALFTKNGKRMQHADISVRFSTQKYKTEFQTLEEMKFNKNLVYGNYFTLQEAGPYRIEVIIKHPKYLKPIKTEFQYQIAHASLSTKSLSRVN